MPLLALFVVVKCIDISIFLDILLSLYDDVHTYGFRLDPEVLDNVCALSGRKFILPLSAILSFL